jgi:hypothetical protein
VTSRFFGGKVTVITSAGIEKIIYLIRGHRVMLDFDLAEIYEVETKQFNQAVKRNLKRFPDDFMFQLTDTEYELLSSQFGKRGQKHGGRRYLPFAFTEQGIAMLSSVLNSDRAIDVNISIMRTFVKLRRVLAADETLVERLAELEKGTNKIFRIVFERLDNLEADLPILSPKRKKINLN